MTTTPADEVKALARIAAVLDKLDDPARRRAVDWLWERYSKAGHEEEEITP
jgi:hypothetical protein